jgi:hypothetical protein
VRRGDYYCRRLGLHLSWVGDLGGWWDEITFHETHDTGFLLACLDRLWTGVPRTKPLSVGVVLLDLVPAARHQLDLFEQQKRQKLLLRSLAARRARVQWPRRVSPGAGELGVLIPAQTISVFRLSRRRATAYACVLANTAARSLIPLRLRNIVLPFGRHDLPSAVPLAAKVEPPTVARSHSIAGLSRSCLFHDN